MLEVKFGGDVAKIALRLNQKNSAVVWQYQSAAESCKIPMLNDMRIRSVDER